MIKGNLYLPGRARVPIPKKSVEEADKLSGKVMLAVDFESGKINWDEEAMKKMGITLQISKDEFLSALEKHKSVNKTAKALGISIGSFYKFKEKYAKEIKEIDKPKGMTMNAEFEKAIAEMEEAAATKEVAAVQEVELVDPEPCPEEIHTPTMAETESFFRESTFNPEEPKTKRGGKRMNALEAVDMMDEAREESYCVTTIFDQRISITPEVRKLLENHRNESEMVVDAIERKLGELTITL